MILRTEVGMAGKLSSEILLVVALTGCGGYQSFTGDVDGAGDTAMDGTPDSTLDSTPDVPPDTAPDTSTDTAPDPVDVVPDTPVTWCGGPEGIGCVDGSFCESPDGSCDPWAFGACVEVPVGWCPEYYSPQCGCDGITYGNPCERRQARVGLRHPGECGSELPCSPYWMPMCGPGETCEAPPDSCWLDGVTGICVPIRDDCGWLWDPECGCDGHTYANVCERMTAGAWLDHRGECGPPCGHPGDPPCTGEAFCEIPTGMCEDAPGMGGECVPVPADCSAFEEMPVCGCDMVTYGNDCLRKRARVQLAWRGPCGE